MAENLISSPAYRVAFSMYVALGGDQNMTFDSVDAIYAAIDELYGKGTRVTIENLSVEITENGGYLYDNEEITGYKPVSVNVNVPQKYTDEQVESLKETARQEGYYSGLADGFTQGESEGYNDGYADGLEDGAEDQKALLEAVTFTDNGTYTKEDGYNEVTVAVEIPTFETESLTKTLKTNGTYNYTPTTDGFSDVNITVDVPTSGDSGLPKIYNGFQFTGGDIAQVDFSQYDWSNVYDTGYFFENCSHSTGDWSNFLENYNGKILSVYYMFNNCSELTSIPQMDTSNVTSMRCMFLRCSSLTTIPQLDTSNVVDMSNMFQLCSSLTSIPQMDTSNVVDMSYMFASDRELLTLPDTLDTTNVVDMNHMFASCVELTSIPQMDTSNVVDMSNMFEYCDRLTSVPQLDTSNVTNMTYMFNNCGKLTSIPQMDTSNVTSMTYMLRYCYNLTDLGGFTNMGSKSSFSTPTFSDSTKLTKESIMNIINNLYDRKTAGYSVITLSFGTTNLAKITDEEKAIATNKGWTLS